MTISSILTTKYHLYAFLKNLQWNMLLSERSLNRLSKVLANERRRYICNVFSQLPVPCSAIDRKGALVSHGFFYNPWKIRLAQSIIKHTTVISRRSQTLPVRTGQHFHPDNVCLAQVQWGFLYGLHYNSYHGSATLMYYRRISLWHSPMSLCFCFYTLHWFSHC